MTDKLQHIKDSAPRVVPALATPGYWRPAGTTEDPAGGVVVRRVEFGWMIEKIQNAEDKIQRLMDEADEVSARYDDACTRVRDLEEAIQRVLEAEVDGDQNFTQTVRNLRAVWARA